jgi:ferredoxin
LLGRAELTMNEPSSLEVNIMRIVVDRSKCTGLGLCESVAPDFFEVQEDGSLELLQSEAAEVQRPELLRAVQVCPTSALSLAD